MNVKNSCGSCGNPLQINDPGGLCPSCLMGHAFQNDGNSPTLDASGVSYPRAEELVGCFPNLEILHLIGHGGMGAVYLARQTNLDRMVALKVLSPRLGNDPSFTERFIREARTLAKLSHPNIVTVFDYGQTENLNYLLMEYVDGINLRDAIQEGKLTPQESLSIVPQICDALQFAHNEGVIHRDIKPENILLDKHGRVKIADFGLAKLLQPNQDQFTLTGTQQVLGTRNYMAPEQIEHPEVVDHRADIYSLGVVFYELLTGELPIGRFAMPSEKAAVTNQLDDVVLRTLEKEPARRFQQASEIRTAVESLGRRKSPNIPRRETVRRQKTVATLPFSIGELYGGLAAAHGIAHLFVDQLELEYQVIDEVLGEFKSDTKKIVIPIADLIKVRFIKGVFSDRIEFQTDRLEGAKDVPNSSQGRFSLRTKRADLELATDFVNQTERLRQGAVATVPSPGYQQPQPRQADFRQPMPPRKSKIFGFSDQPTLNRQEVVDALKIPAIGFMVIGIIHLLLAAKGLVKAGAWEKFEPFSFSLFSGAEVSLYLPNFSLLSFSTIMLFVVGLLMLSISSRLRRPRDYTFVYAALILVMLVPAHAAYVLTLALAIWALVVLSDGRCKTVYQAELRRPRIGHRPFASFVHVLLAVILVVGLLGAAGALLLYLSLAPASKVDTRQQPQVEKMLKVDGFSESEDVPDSDSDSDSDSTPDLADSSRDTDSSQSPTSDTDTKPDTDSSGDKEDKSDDFGS